MTTSDDNDKKDSLDAAKQKLSEIRGRPFDVDKILATNRAKEERQRIAAKAAQAKLEQTIKAARDRRHTLHAEDLKPEKSDLEVTRLRKVPKDKTHFPGEHPSDRS